MSVKVHEPVCEDSAQDLYFWFDHFLGDQIKDEWRSTGDAGGSAVVVDAQTGGVVRITTDDNDGDDWRIDWGDIHSLLVSKKVTMEIRLRRTTVTTCDVEIMLFNIATEVVKFRSNNNGDWELYCRDAGGITNPTSGISVDAGWHIYRIECFPTDEVHFYIDGVECANSPVTTNITVLHLNPRLELRCEDEGTAQVMDIDYCVVRQER